MINLLLADDHTIITEGVSNLLAGEEGIHICKTCKNGQEVLNYLEGNHDDVDLLLLDIDMPVMNGFECAEAVISQFPEVPIAMLTMHQEKGMIKRFIDLGTKGYFLKTISRSELILAIKRIHDGGEYFPSDVTKSLLQDNAESHSIKSVELNPILKELSIREREITIQIASGLSNKEIGNKLFISPRTVDTHRTNIMRKIGVNNVAGVVRFAFQNQLIS